MPRNVLITLILAFLCSFGVFSTLNAQDVNELLSEANTKFNQHEEKQALEIYEKIIELDPDNHEALWKASFLSSRVGNRFENDERKQRYFYHAMKWADKAMKVDSTDINSYYALGVALGRMAMIQPPKQRVAGTRKIQRVAQKGLQLNPDHAGLNHVLGYLHYRIANASKIEKMAANVLFGGMPSDSSNELAIKHLKKAVENRDDYLLYHFDLARTYHANDQDSLAREELNKVLSLPGYSPDDPTIKEDARELLEELS